MSIRMSILCMVLVACLPIGTLAGAHEPINTQGAVADESAVPASGMPVYVQNIDPAAAEAVKVVDAFSAAIKAVELGEAGKLLDPQVLILESGGSERSRDEYMRSHIIADAAFLQNAKQQLRYRQARADGNMAWVATESTLIAQQNGKAIVVSSTETMLLKKTTAGWRIAHIHWSSRPQNK